MKGRENTTRRQTGGKTRKWKKGNKGIIKNRTEEETTKQTKMKQNEKDQSKEHREMGIFSQTPGTGHRAGEKEKRRPPLPTIQRSERNEETAECACPRHWPRSSQPAATNKKKKRNVHIQPGATSEARHKHAECQRLSLRRRGRLCCIWPARLTRGLSFRARGASCLGGGRIWLEEREEETT